MIGNKALAHFQRTGGWCEPAEQQGHSSSLSRTAEQADTPHLTKLLRFLPL